MSQAFKFVIECEGCKLEKEANVDIHEDSRLCKRCLWEKAKEEFSNILQEYYDLELMYVFENLEELGLKKLRKPEYIEDMPLHQLPDCLFKSFRMVEAFFEFIKPEDVLEKRS